MKELILDNWCNLAISSGLACSQRTGKQFLCGEIDLEGQFLTPLSKELICTLEQNDFSSLV